MIVLGIPDVADFVVQAIGYGAIDSGIGESRDSVRITNGSSSENKLTGLLSSWRMYWLYS